VYSATEALYQTAVSSRCEVLRPSVPEEQVQFAFLEETAAGVQNVCIVGDWLLDWQPVERPEKWSGRG